jgi:hypothetical protein
MKKNLKFAEDFADNYGKEGTLKDFSQPEASGV